MIFYLAVDAENNTKILGTQADAGKVNRDFQQIDIPVDKAGLMAWIQQMLDETLNAAPIVEVGDTETIQEILYEMIGMGGGDGDTIREFAERIAALQQTTETVTIATADMRDDKDGAPSISHTIPVAPTKLDPEMITDLVMAMPFTARSVLVDELWDVLPMARKFHFAGLAIEDGRNILSKMTPSAPQ